MEGDAYRYGYAAVKLYLAGNNCLTPEVEAEIDQKKEVTCPVFLIQA